jgi:hypothetical protein
MPSLFLVVGLCISTEFGCAWERGGILADAEVAYALYRKAIGLSSGWRRTSGPRVDGSTTAGGICGWSESSMITKARSSCRR